MSSDKEADSLQTYYATLHDIADKCIDNPYPGGIKYVPVCLKLWGVTTGTVFAQRIGDGVTTTRKTLEVDHYASTFRFPDQID